MSLVYDELLPSKGMAINLDKINPNKPWAKHVENWYYLKFIYTSGTVTEKIQAQKELIICERKLTFWQRHPTWSKEAAAQTVKDFQSKWQSKEKPNR